jgi:hypothetical protein
MIYVWICKQYIYVYIYIHLYNVHIYIYTIYSHIQGWWLSHPPQKYSFGLLSQIELQIDVNRTYLKAPTRYNICIHIYISRHSNITTTFIIIYLHWLNYAKLLQSPVTFHHLSVAIVLSVALYFQSDLSPLSRKKLVGGFNQWVDLREHLQDTMGFPNEIRGFQANSKIQPIARTLVHYSNHRGVGVGAQPNTIDIPN